MSISSEQIEILNSIADMYLSVYLFKLDEDCYEEVNSHSIVHNIVGSSGSLSERFYSVMDILCSSDSIDDIRKFIDLSTLNRRLKSRNHIYCDFKGVLGWATAHFFVTRRKEDRSVSELLFAVQSIDEIKSAELEANAIRDAVLRMYHTVLLCDSATGTYKILKISDANLQEQEEPRDLQRDLNYMAENLIPEEYKDSVKEFCDLSTLEARMRNKNDISIEHIGINKLWSRSSFVEISRDKRNRLDKFLYVSKYIEDEKQAEKRYIEEINDATYNAEHDKLTNVYNRYGFENKLREIYESEEDMSVAAIILDIDNFKSVNDNYGHEIGDEVLRVISNTMRKTLRRDDILCRWGGEEFLIFVHHNSNPVIVAERVRKAVEEASINYDSVTLKVTISAGVCYEENIHQSTFEELVNVADQCLYISKRNGKNQVNSKQVRQ